MGSEINFLKQENARLMAKITRLEIENTDVKAKYDKAMNEIMKLRAELKSKIENSIVDQLDNTSEISSKSKIQFSYTSKQKKLGDKETDAFLNESGNSLDYPEYCICFS
ncbi:4180_t:CDS:2 [Ambispora leptoticha]|uniref:4180_t:CDS:1 n=1 Tax=Ambispora leptoticha TaxID=144679 RepID=A0A9N9BV60_9GLOM|nr:4180_t:CDS:2 [Ambispora leptoticha]